jgi:hypothetical protein
MHGWGYSDFVMLHLEPFLHVKTVWDRFCHKYRVPLLNLLFHLHRPNNYTRRT